MRRELQELRTNQMADRVFTTKNFSIVNANIRRIALQPGVRGTVARGQRGRGNDDAIGAQQPAIAGQRVAPPSLSPNPKNLFELWQEYEIGIWGGGNQQSCLPKKSAVDR